MEQKIRTIILLTKQVSKNIKVLIAILSKLFSYRYNININI
jgi:hypothetical protein